ncbi:MAG TPA: cohesin domain-containing protein [Thermoanaerobaculia bacterium]|nr:cohesin domain-containing protein [Thermoanaerobaculia bacterium]HUM29672.1 cohesin domain-containing protein [Thermoanaerobaculia bacterium]HXK67323.1 cohesin domain-containing protein [Thermoanaerobaculia bacterium]
MKWYALFCITFLLSTSTFGASLSLRHDETAEDKPGTILLFIVGAPDLRAFQFVATYDPAELTFHEFRLGAMAKDALFAVNDRKPGEIRVAAAAGRPLEGDGKLAYLIFEGKGTVKISAILINGEAHPDLDISLSEGRK